MFRNYHCFDMLPFVCAHFATLSLGMIFRKQKLGILWKGGTLRSPRIVHSEINCDSLKNLIQYFYRKLKKNLTIFILFNLYQMCIWTYFSLSGTETSWVSLSKLMTVCFTLSWDGCEKAHQWNCSPLRIKHLWWGVTRGTEDVESRRFWALEVKYLTALLLLLIPKHKTTHQVDFVLEVYF